MAVVSVYTTPSSVAVDRADILAEELVLPGNGARFAGARRDRTKVRTVKYSSRSTAMSSAAYPGSAAQPI
jgi:hypothetical protein